MNPMHLGPVWFTAWPGGAHLGSSISPRGAQNQRPGELPGQATLARVRTKQPLGAGGIGLLTHGRAPLHPFQHPIR